MPEENISVYINPLTFSRQRSEIHISWRLNHAISNTSAIGIKMVSVTVVIVSVVVKYYRVIIEALINPSVPGMIEIM